MRLLIYKIQQWWLSLIVRFHGRPGALRRAKKRAVKYHFKHGKRYRVFFISNRFKAMSRDDLMQLKHTNKNWNISSTAMNQFAFFDTNNISTT